MIRSYDFRVIEPSAMADDLRELLSIADQLYKGNYAPVAAPLDQKKIGRGIGQQAFTVPPAPRDDPFLRALADERRES